MSDIYDQAIIRQGVCACGFLGVKAMANNVLSAGDAYRLTDIATAGPSELLSILYNDIIENCNQACQALDDGLSDHAAERIEKAIADATFSWHNGTIF